MNAPSFPIRVVAAKPGDSALAQRLRKEVDGEVLFDAASRGRYSTDASIYQVEPIGIVVPRTPEAPRGNIGTRCSAAIAMATRAASGVRGTTMPIGSTW